MLAGVFHQRLQNHAGHFRHENGAFHIDAVIEPAVEPGFLNHQVVGNGFHFFFQGYRGLDLIETVTHQTGQSGYQLFRVLVAFNQRHPGDGIEGIEQKMRIDLILQGQKLRFLQVFFHFPLFLHEVNEGLLLTFQLAADMEMIHQLRDFTAGEPHITAEGVAPGIA